MKTNRIVTALMSVMHIAMTYGANIDPAKVMKEELLEYEHQLNAGGTLEIANTAGRISISGWDKDMVYVKVVKRAPDQLLSSVAIDAQFTDTTASLKTLNHPAPSYSQTYSLLGFFTYTYTHICPEGCISVDYRIKVPRHTCIKLLEAGNSIVHVKNIDSAVSIKNGKGDIKTDEISGPLEIQGELGDITVTDSKDTVTVATTSGSICVNNTSKDVTIEVKSGDVDIANIQGALSLTAKHGDIKADNIAQAATVSVRQGDVSLTHVKGPISIDCKRGYVKVNKAETSCKIQTFHGDITLIQKSTKPKDIIDLQSVHGDIRLYVVKHIDASLKAETERGAISFDGSLTDVYHPAEALHNLEIYIGKKGVLGSTINLKTVDGTIAIASY
jgi:hypothetical protein